jgi:glycogen operon protein
VAELAHRLAGSNDVFDRDLRAPTASINYVTAHDGFTLEDLVSYDEKHNEANGEENRDGSDYNLSSNHGVEGPTDDPAVLALRAKQKRNLLATLLLSQGVPMLCAGDEMGRSQRGNNNAYCQDNEIGWLDWTLSPADERLLDFVKLLTKVRAEHPTLRRSAFLRGKIGERSGLKDVAWIRPDGREMTNADWGNSTLRTLCVRLDGVHEGEEAAGVLLMLLNAEEHPISLRLPTLGFRESPAWRLIVDTSNPEERGNTICRGGDIVPISDRSLVLYRSERIPGVNEAG